MNSSVASQSGNSSEKNHSDQSGKNLYEALKRSSIKKKANERTVAEDGPEEESKDIVERLEERKIDINVVQLTTDNSEGLAEELR